MFSWLKSDSLSWAGWFGTGINTGKSFFDAWTLAHLTFWLFIGSCLWPSLHKYAFISKQRVLAFSYCLLLSYVWEIFERFAEKKWPAIWLHPESFWNSYLSDPLTVVIGVFGMMLWLDCFAS